MKYKITIEEISEGFEVEDVYVNEKDRTHEHPEQYRKVQVPKTISTVIYTQKIDKDINLMEVIKAFNNEIE